MKNETSKRDPFRDNVTQLLNELLVYSTPKFISFCSVLLVTLHSVLFEFSQTESEDGDGDDGGGGGDGDDGGDEEVPAGGEEVPAGGDEEEVGEVAADAADEVGEGAADAAGAADDDDEHGNRYKKALYY